jgi:hypothetical protein
MIIYLNNRKYIEEQREFGIGNLFKNIGGVFNKKSATAAASSSVVSGRVKRGGNNVGFNSSSVTPVVPNTKPANTPKTTVPGTNVKVDANADIQMQAHQYLNSGQVKSAQANAGKVTANANQGNKKFEKQQQLLNQADGANQVLNAGGNTYVMGAKSTSDIRAAVNNANNGTVAWSKNTQGANTNQVNINQYQGQVTNKPTPPVQQGTGVSGAEIKQQSQNLQGQRNPSEVTADEASRNTKLTITKPKTTSNTNTQQTNTQPANNTQQTNTQQPANNQPANNTQQTPPTPPPTTQPTNNTQSNTGQNNNTTTNNNNNNSKTENKPNWWNRWGKTTAKVTAGVGAVGTIGAGVYGLHELHKMTSSDD